MPFDPFLAAPQYQAPTPYRPDILTDDHRVIVTDPDGNWLGQPGDLGASGLTGRLVYAERTPASRAF